MRMQRTSKLIVWPVLVLLLFVGIRGCSRGVEIPLDTIWTRGIRGMPGTQNIETLEPGHFGPAVRQLSDQEQIDLLDSSLTSPSQRVW